MAVRYEIQAMLVMGGPLKGQTVCGVFKSTCGPLPTLERLALVGGAEGLRWIPAAMIIQERLMVTVWPTFKAAAWELVHYFTQEDRRQTDAEMATKAKQELEERSRRKLAPYDRH